MNIPRRWLVDLRMTANLTQKALAEASGISRNYLSEIENGHKRPSMTAAMSIADVLGFDFMLFFSQGCLKSRHRENHAQSA